MKSAFKLMASAVIFMLAVSCAPTEKTFEKFLQKNYFKDKELWTIESITFDKAYQTLFNDETCMDLLDEAMDEAEDMLDYLDDMEDANDAAESLNYSWDLDDIIRQSDYYDDVQESYAQFKVSHKNYQDLIDKLENRESELDPIKLLGWEVICGYRYLKDNSYSEIRFIIDKRIKNILYVDFDGTELRNKAAKFLELSSKNDMEGIYNLLMEE